MATTTHILGYPRIGEKRELKFAQEKYWRGEIDQAELKKVGADLRAKNWQTQTDAGLSFATAGDFAWYDHVLTTTLLWVMCQSVTLMVSLTWIRCSKWVAVNLRRVAAVRALRHRI